MSTVFGKIIAGKLPCQKVYEDDHILAIKDIHPVAPVHLLLILKKEVPSLQTLVQEDLPLMGEVVRVAQKLAKEYNVEHGYRLLTNVGAEGGQTIEHLHFHLIGGRPLRTMG